MDEERYEYAVSILKRLEEQYQAMAVDVGKPVPQRVPVERVEGYWFRYPVQSDNLICFLKGVKLVSTLNGALILLRDGYVQECGALFRMPATATRIYFSGLRRAMGISRVEIKKDSLKSVFRKNLRTQPTP